VEHETKLRPTPGIMQVLLRVNIRTHSKGLISPDLDFKFFLMLASPRWCWALISELRRAQLYTVPFVEVSGLMIWPDSSLVILPKTLTFNYCRASWSCLVGVHVFTFRAFSKTVKT